MSLFSISGTHAVGKTTLIQQLKDQYSDRFQFHKSNTRDLLSLGLGINENASDLGQLAIATADVQFVLSTNSKYDYVTDRCILDTLVYSKDFLNTGRISKNTYNAIEWMSYFVLARYSHIFVLRPQWALIGDGVRSEDTVWQEEINYQFQCVVRGWSQFFADLDINLPSIPSISFLLGSDEEKIKQIIEVIEKKKMDEQVFENNQELKHHSV